MKRILLIAALALCACDFTKTDKVHLFPGISPYETGYLKVSPLHEIHYELCGNRQGIPIFVLHGGPGGSKTPYMRRFFDPEKFLIVLHDQRGAGLSKPYAETRENTTRHLVDDIETLRDFLNVEQIILLGGSWGATLALAYAESYPQNVKGLILRGVFTATQAEIDHFYHGGVHKFFPETYEKFVNSLPDPKRRPIPDYLYQLLTDPDSTVQQKYAWVWAEYEVKLSSLHIADYQVQEIMENSNPLAFALLENYYMANGCFFEEDQLLKNADKIKDIKTIIVNGRYDMICPPENAYRLHKLLPNSELVVAEEAGHWMGEPPIEKALLSAVKKFEQ
ncbi:prolyl aminopeptidase [candidate division KSB1 bacterium]|nr:prolyl aminopeptidase [candidate division KSB1 bacterium]